MSRIQHHQQTHPVTARHRRTAQNSGGTIKLKVRFTKEDEFIVAYCPELDLSTYANSLQEAIEAFDEALEIFLKDVTVKGTLEKILLQLGWKLQQVPTFRYIPPSQRLHEHTHARAMKTIERIVQLHAGIPSYRPEKASL